MDDESIEPISNFLKEFPDDLFFIAVPALAKKCPNIGQYIFDRISKSKFTSESINASVALAREQQHFSFKISQFYVDYINNHFNDNLDITFQILNSIHFLHTLKWTEISQNMISLFNNLSIETKQSMIPSFYQVLKQIQNPTNLFINFLFIASSDPKAKIRRLALELIPDDFLVLFNEQAVFTILESFYDDENKNVSLSALNVIGRIQEKCPLTTLGFFSSRIASQIPQLKSISSLSSRRKQMEILPTLIHLSGDVIDGYIDDYVNYFLEILNTPLQPMANIYEATIKKDYRNDDRIIRKNVLFCLNELTSKIKFFNTEKVHQLVTAITNQLFVSTHRSLHIEVGNTLLLIFRSCDFQHNANPIDIIKMHTVIFNFLANCQDSGVIDVFLRLFGTIGPLDPYLFHTQEDFASNETFDWFPICDVSKRQTCYLHFVMRFVLGQLQQHSNVYEPPVLIIAIVYIFQSDPTNSLLFLGQIVHVFSNILTEKLMDPPDAIFHFLRSIIMLVDVSILSDPSNSDFSSHLHEAANGLGDSSFESFFPTTVKYLLDPQDENLVIDVLNAYGEAMDFNHRFVDYCYQQSFFYKMPLTNESTIDICLDLLGRIFAYSPHIICNEMADWMNYFFGLNPTKMLYMYSCLIGQIQDPISISAVLDCLIQQAARFFELEIADQYITTLEYLCRHQGYRALRLDSIGPIILYFLTSCFKSLVICSEDKVIYL